MLRIRSQGWTRQGEERHENQDAFRVVPALGLFLVVDAMTTARAAEQEEECPAAKRTW